MPHKYHVHLYREMRLTFADVEASSHEEAATIARDKPSEEADGIDDCGGESFAALVDVAGDESHEHSRMLGFEEERLRKAAPALLEALRAFLAVDEMAAECAEWKWESLEGCFRTARDAVALVEGGGAA